MSASKKAFLFCLAILAPIITGISGAVYGHQSAKAEFMAAPWDCRLTPFNQ